MTCNKCQLNKNISFQKHQDSRRLFQFCLWIVSANSLSVGLFVSFQQNKNPSAASLPSRPLEKQTSQPKQENKKTSDHRHMTQSGPQMGSQPSHKSACCRGQANKGETRQLRLVPHWTTRRLCSVTNRQVHTLTDYGHILSQAESSDTYLQIWTFPTS